MVDRFDRQTALADDAATAEHLERANEEISRLRARVSTLERALESETRTRLDAGAMLASERMRTKQLQDAMEQYAPKPASSDRHIGELETAWAQIHHLQAALARSSQRWWHRGGLS